MAGVDSFELVLNKYILKDLKDLNDSLALVGLFYLGKLTIGLVKKIYFVGKTYVIPNLVSNEKLLNDVGNWACINGCTNSVGLGYVYQLAKRRKNLILIDTDSFLLDKIANDLISNCQIEAITIQADPHNLDSYLLIENEAKSRDIGLLINTDNFEQDINVKEFDKISRETIESELSRSTTSIILLVRSLLPSMIKRNKGVIIYVSSVNSLMSIPRDPILASSHSFIQTLFESLSYEYRNTNIKFQCFKTLVSQNTNEMDDASLMNLARNSLAYTGNGSKEIVCVGNYLSNGIQVYLGITLLLKNI